MIDAAKIEELLARAEGLQRQIEDLQDLRDVVLEPIRHDYVALVKAGVLKDPLLRRLHDLPPQNFMDHT